MSVLPYSTFCIIGFDSLIEYGGLTLVLIAVFIETGLLVGLVIPGGESLLFTAGLLAGTKVLDVNIVFLVIFISLAAFIGDLTGFTIGRKLGRDYFLKKDNFFFRKRNMERAERFYEKYGVSAIILGRFLPFIRTFNPLLSGITGMEFRKFFIVTGLACLLYVNVTVFAGYLLGRYFPGIKNYMEFIIPAIIILMLVPVIKGFIKEIKRPA